MFLHALLRRPVAGSLALIALSVGAAATASAADIDVTRAEIAAGKLVIAGSTATANMRVRLEGRSGAAFNARSDARRAFKFNLAYLPSDCVVTLETLTARAAAGAANDVVVANCARGLSPRGPWGAEADYSANDVVTYRGSSWLARRDNAGKAPEESADWQLFAAKGGDGEPGGDGEAGGSGGQGGLRAPPTGPAGGDLTGTYPNPLIDGGAVTSAKIAPGAVTTGKIADDAVTNAKIVNFAVTAAKIADGAVGPAKIANGAVGTAKIADGAVTEPKIADGAVTSAKVLDDTIAGGGLAPADLQSNSVGFAEIQTDAVQATEIADNSIDSGEIVDFTLTNQDVGVLFAEVNAAATLANSSGGVTVVRVGAVGAGNYEVDFARNITACTAVATIGPAGAGSALGEVNVADRSANVEAIFVDTNTSAGAASDLPFRLVVVC